MNEILPVVSIILTSFNHEKYIREAIDSVLTQTFSDFELIILDDASNDKSWEIIRSYADPRIKAIQNSENRFATFRMNEAITNICSGKYIAIHHSDDIWEVDKLEKQVCFLDSHPQYGAVFTNTLAIGENSNPLNDPSHVYSEIFNQKNRTRYEWLSHFFYFGNALCHPSVLIRKKCYEDCGVYRYGMAQLPDFDMWIRLCLSYEIYVMSERLVRFRVRENEANASADKPEVRIRVFTESYQTLENFLKIGVASDLLKIFPSAKKYVTNDHEQANPSFIFAMLLLEGDSLPSSKFLALNILFDLLNDRQIAGQLKSAHGFDQLDLIRLTGKHDIFSIERLLALNQVLVERDGQVTALNQALVERDGRVAVLNQALVECNGQVAALNQALTESAEAIQNIKSSTSWKV
ncbi:MAG TPA: glycosyltransferase, partial [Arenimonas sp.]|nr:glycosyltransferase [Arenimonas sp.]